jgi:hypothetical protein
MLTGDDAQGQHVLIHRVVQQTYSSKGLLVGVVGLSGGALNIGE